ncbi:metallophosphoesterase [Portibacter marinus]|uniref:metallophosphoesterase n=1 Tax=Portibacter marinus TaxID=2898660 RepID=UPI001F2B3B3A|nr:metallophosphoesterase [Portibacter marinus]
MNRLPVFIIFSAFYLAFCYIAYLSLNAVFDGHVLMKSIFGSLVIIGVFGIYRGLNQFTGRPRTPGSNFLIGFSFSLFICLLLFTVGQFFIYIIKAIIAVFMWNKAVISYPTLWPSYVLLIVVSLIFISMLYGAIWGKYRYSVERIKMKIKDLPEAFRGFKIAQISDIHSGTFDSIRQVEKGVQKINDEKPDLFLFTGDLVNFHKDEIDPFIPTFAKIKAPFGQYSILGNHDYYGMANVPQAERGNYWSQFDQKHEQIGFKLLRNTNVQIHKSGAVLNIIGVENWGTGGFPKTGDLSQAIRGMDANAPSILMSHDPSHWDHVVLKTKPIIDLTLSGHTHGMQFGINSRWLKWSPVKYRYKRWMGLYEEDGRQLYVNRGFGFLGWPGRLFMWPEITIFELEPAE